MSIQPKRLHPGDKIALASLSRGLLGEPFVRHELDLGLKRLREFGLEPVILPNALKENAFLEAHPEARAADLKAAFLDDSIKGILCAIGGDDTYRLYPYLFEDPEFVGAVRRNPKIFSGFSDSTMNHLMFAKLGLQTFYGPTFSLDLAELDTEMLPYTRKYFEKFFLEEDGFEIESSPVWYGERENYKPTQLGIPRPAHRETRGHEVLNGVGTVRGKLWGGCLESLYFGLTGDGHPGEDEVCARYGVFPSGEAWKEVLLFWETSEEAPAPEEVEKMLLAFRKRGILSSVKGLVVGKPIEEKYYEEYKAVYRKVFAGLSTPVLYNLNFGHASPRCVLPYGAEAELDCEKKSLRIIGRIFQKD